MPYTIDHPKDMCVGDMVWYMDENKIVMPAIVTFMNWGKCVAEDDRPIINCSAYFPNARISPRVNVEPAHLIRDNAEGLWTLCNKWAFINEPPEDQITQPVHYNDYWTPLAGRGRPKSWEHTTKNVKHIRIGSSNEIVAYDPRDHAKT